MTYKQKETNMALGTRRSVPVKEKAKYDQPDKLTNAGDSKRTQQQHNEQLQARKGPVSTTSTTSSAAATTATVTTAA